jgi:preprotein translocase subunit SecA
MLEEAAFAKIDAEPLDRIPSFADPRYGAEKLAEWVKGKFTKEIDPDVILKYDADDDLRVRDLIIETARELYEKREAEFPADFIMQRTMMLARQDPAGAFESLGKWARDRFGMELTPDEIKTTPPAKIRERIIEASRKAMEDDDLSVMVEKAMATTSDDELDELLKERYGEGITERMRYLDENEREPAIRARVETLSRPELVQFEQMVLIETLDTSWKDHLYSMDQLRDTIGFRAIAQTDPKIEYKREGQRMFKGMMREIREKVTGYIFRARLTAPTPRPMQQAPRQAPAQQATQPQQQRPQSQGFATGNIVGSSIVGPGFTGGQMLEPPKPKPAPESISESDSTNESDDSAS